MVSSLLQWGRRLVPAESVNNLRYRYVWSWASMGPQVGTCGKIWQTAGAVSL